MFSFIFVNENYGKIKELGGLQDFPVMWNTSIGACSVHIVRRFNVGYNASLARKWIAETQYLKCRKSWRLADFQLWPAWPRKGEKNCREGHTELVEKCMGCFQWKELISNRFHNWQNECSELLKSVEKISSAVYDIIRSSRDN